MKSTEKAWRKNANDNWETPESLLVDILHFAYSLELAGITLDPATTRENPTGAMRIRTPDCDPDGLETEWAYVGVDESGSGLVYVNPPYRAAWYAKIANEADRLMPRGHMISLLPAKPGTKYFQRLASSAEARVFLRGRLTFRGAPDPAPFESALLYWGSAQHRFRAAFEGKGWAI